MKGTLLWGKKEYNANKDFGFGVTGGGYNVYVNNKNGLPIVKLVFPDLESRNMLYNKWRKEFPKK